MFRYSICQIIVNCKYPFWDFPLNLRLFTALSALDELNKCGINRAYACIVCGTKLPHKSLLTQLGDNLPRLGTPTEHPNNIWKYFVHIGYAKYFCYNVCFYYFDCRSEIEVNFFWILNGQLYVIGKTKSLWYWHIFFSSIKPKYDH